MDTNDYKENNSQNQKEAYYYTNVQDISIEPGEDFIKWKQLTKELLKQRESHLMEVRCEVTKAIIRTAIHRFATNNGFATDVPLIFDENYQRKTLQELYQTIDGWKGVQVNRLKKHQMVSFKPYFVIGKNWLDQNKKNVWSTYYWIKILQQTQKFAMLVARNQFKNKCLLFQTQCADCLQLSILHHIFDGTVQFVQTKQQPLLPHGTIKHSQEIHAFLLHLDTSLDINNWCELQKETQKAKDALDNKKRKRTGNAKLLVMQLKETLVTLISISQNKLLNNTYCHDAAYCIHTGLQQIAQPHPQQIPQLPPITNMLLMTKQPPKPPTPVRPYNYMYYPQHSASRTVSDYRFDPMQGNIARGRGRGHGPYGINYNSVNVSGCNLCHCFDCMDNNFIQNDFSFGDDYYYPPQNQFQQIPYPI